MLTARLGNWGLNKGKPTIHLKALAPAPAQGLAHRCVPPAVTARGFRIHHFSGLLMSITAHTKIPTYTRISLDRQHTGYLCNYDYLKPKSQVISILEANWFSVFFKPHSCKHLEMVTELPKGCDCVTGSSLAWERHRHGRGKTWAWRGWSSGMQLNKLGYSYHTHLLLTESDTYLWAESTTWQYSVEVLGRWILVKT